MKVFLVKTTMTEKDLKDFQFGEDAVELTPSELTALKILLDVELNEVEKLPSGQEPYYTILKALLKKLSEVSK